MFGFVVIFVVVNWTLSKLFKKKYDGLSATVLKLKKKCLVPKLGQEDEIEITNRFLPLFYSKPRSSRSIYFEYFEVITTTTKKKELILLINTRLFIYLFFLDFKGFRVIHGD